MEIPDSGSGERPPRSPDPFAVEKEAYFNAKNLPNAADGLKALFTAEKPIVEDTKVGIIEGLIQKRQVSSQRRFYTSIDGDLSDRTSLKYRAEKIAVNVRELVEAYKEDESRIANPDSAGGRTLKALKDNIPRPQHIETGASVILYDLIHKALTDPDIDPLKVLTEIELLQIQTFDPDSFPHILESILKGAEGKATSAEIEVFRAKFAGKEKDDRELKSWQEIGRMSDEEVEQAIGGHEIHYIKKFLPAKYEGIINAIYLPERHFPDYIKKLSHSIRQEFIKERGREPDQAELQIKVSDEFHLNVVNTLGRLYNRIDQSPLNSTWEEEEQKGGIYSGIRIIAESFIQSLNALAGKKFPPDSDIAKFQFYTKDQVQYDVNVPSESLAQHLARKYPHIERELKSARKEGEVINEEELLTEPFFRRKKDDFPTYIQQVLKDTEAHRQFRSVFRNVLSVFNKPKDERAGYFRTIGPYVETFMTALDVDLLAQQPDADLMFSSTRLLDKLQQLENARHNYIAEEQADQPDPYGKLPPRAELVEGLLKIWKPELEGEEENWRILRALVMALGETYTISLKSIENSARNLAPMGKGAQPDYSSFEPQDAGPTLVFNPFAQFGLRYLDLMEARMGGLIFVPVDGAEVDGKSTISKLWEKFNYKIIKENSDIARNEFHEGRSPQTEEDDYLRLVNWENPFKVGSIYTRGWWRYWAGYRPYFAIHEKKVNITKCWKNVEGIGIEVLRDFVGFRIEDLNDDFFELNEGRGDRLELVDYLYRRYFKYNQAVDPAEVRAKFDEIEAAAGSKHKGLQKEYKKFFYQVFTRAMKQTMPTKFIRYEANRQVVQRQRAYKKIRFEAGMDPAPGVQGDKRFSTAVADICLAEEDIRSEISDRLKKVYRREREEKDNGTPLYDLTDEVNQITSDYVLTKERLMAFLEKYYAGDEYAERRRNALIVFDKSDEFVETTMEYAGEDKPQISYMDRFAAKWQKGLPYAECVEQLDRSLFAHRASGRRGPARAIIDIANADDYVKPTILGYFEKMLEVSRSGTFNHMVFIGELHKFSKTMKQDVGVEAYRRLCTYMNIITKVFFMKNVRDVFRPFLGMTAGKANSWSGAIAGADREFTSVAEADKMDLWKMDHDFIKYDILPADAVEPGEETEYEDKPVKVRIPFTKKEITLFTKKELVPELGGYSINKIRRDTHMTNPEVMKESFFGRALPIGVLLIMATMIVDALKRVMGDQGGGRRGH